MGVFNQIKMIWHKRSSSAYIKYLRKKGIHIGEHCIIRAPRTARIDVSRPSLVTIGNNVDMNMNFQILTHDWASLVFRTKYNDRKRKQVALAEAVEYVQSIQKRFKRDPFKRELYEEFIYFTHKDNIEQYEQEGSPVKSQLGIAYTDFIQRDEANFKDYEAFLQYVNKKGVISSENNNIIKNE